MIKTVISESCSSEHLFVSLNGRAWDERSTTAGIYQKIVNGTSVYWLKEEDKVPKAIWFSKLSGQWIVGRLDEFGGRAGYLFTSGATICPDSHGSEWKYGDGNGFVIARNSVNISKWTTGEKSFAKQIKKHKTHSSNILLVNIYRHLLKANPSQPQGQSVSRILNRIWCLQHCPKPTTSLLGQK